MTEMIADAKLGSTWFGAFYSSAEVPVFSADRIQRAVGVFVSQAIDGTSDLLTWKSLSWSASLPTSTRLYFYVRSAGSTASLEEQVWQSAADKLRDAADVSPSTK